LNAAILAQLDSKQETRFKNRNNNDQRPQTIKTTLKNQFKIFKIIEKKCFDSP
jgi:hypothetical protein